MAHPAYLREKARELRQLRRLTIDELAERLALPRTTIYYWVRDMPIPRSGSGGGWSEAARRKGNRTMKRNFRRLREEAYADGQRTFATLASDPTFRDFVCLYIAEGYKRCRNVVSISNSDPAVVGIAHNWIERFARNLVSYWIQYHADQDLVALVTFWASKLGIDPAVIKLQRKSSSNQLSRRTWRSKHGVLTVCANDTHFRARLEAWMDSLRATWL